jgi:arsenate reductase
MHSKNIVKPAITYTGLPKVAFVCTHNSCRSQIAEALGVKMAKGIFRSYSAGTAIKSKINSDAVRLMKDLYGIDMEASQFNKLVTDIPTPDVVIYMGCDISCPSLPHQYDENWNLSDPTGKSDEEFIKIIKEIESDITHLIAELS